MEVPRPWTENWKLSTGASWKKPEKHLLKVEREKREWNPTKWLIVKLNIVNIFLCWNCY